MSARIDVQFASEGLKCGAWLYLPESKTPRPVVILAHGLGGTREMRLDAFAERFCDAGYACLVFDYRHFGSSEGEPRQLLDIKRQLQDWSSAIQFVRGLPKVDSQQIILWGTSFGGGHVLVAAAEDQHVSAVISQCPFTDGLASSLATDMRSSLKVTALAIRDKIGSLLGLPPVMVDTAGAPASAALMTAPDAQSGYLQLVPAGTRFQNQVAARFALDIIRHFPGRRVAEISCPVLFCVCKTDSVAPAKATLRHARKARLGEIKLYQEGHFDIYVGEAFEHVVADQIDFLRRHVPVVA